MLSAKHETSTLENKRDVSPTAQHDKVEGQHDKCKQETPKREVFLIDF